MAPFLGGVSLGDVPHIIAIVERVLKPGELDELKSKGLCLLELRVDSFSLPFSAVLDFAKMARSKGFGLLGTVRPQSQKYKEDERGKDRIGAKGEQFELFEQLLPYVDAIDVELETENRQALFALARKAKRLFLLSTHNYSYTPEIKQMETVLQEAQNYKADFVKLAYYAKDQKDLGRLFRFACDYYGRRQKGWPHLIWIAMGPWGLLSRVLASFSGSLFSYAFIDKPNAPGQFSVDQLRQEFLRYHPDYCSYVDAL